MRIGRIPYINCYPVYGAIDRGIVTLDAELVDGVPTDLNRRMGAGELDISVVSAVEYARDSERYLLLYENARHNVGGNPPPPEALGKFTTQAFFDEPVWRKDRINAINQHFITAFLDLYLKGDATRREYLELPAKSTDRPAWKGFQPRWALGLEWDRRPAR